MFSGDMLLSSNEVLIMLLWSGSLHPGLKWLKGGEPLRPDIFWTTYLAHHAHGIFQKYLCFAGLYTVLDYPSITFE